MTDLARSGAILGFLVGAGLLLAWFGLPRHRQAGLADRVLPYLKDTPRPSNLLATNTQTRGVIATLFAPVIGELSGHVERVMGGAASIRRRLLRAGLAPDVDKFRAQQVIWGVAGGAAMLAVGTLAIFTRGTSPVLVVLLAAIGVASGLVAADWLLSHRATKREERMLAEFPTVAELLALAVGAGEGAVGALERVCRLSHGALSDELRQCLADARAGASLQVALQGLADRTGLMSLTRFVDGIVIAVERGTPSRGCPACAGSGRARGRAPGDHGGRGQEGDRHDGSGRLSGAPHDCSLCRLPRLLLPQLLDVTPPKGSTMTTIHRSLVRAQLAAMGLVDSGHRRRERGDVPGWVLITLMTAGLVAILWAVAETQIANLFQRALDRASEVG